MKIRRREVKKLLRTLEDARILVDEGTPIGGYRQSKLENAYDALLSVEEALRDGLRKRGSKRGSKETRADVHGGLSPRAGSLSK